MDPYLIGLFGFADPYLMQNDMIQNNININANSGDVEFDIDTPRDKYIDDERIKRKDY